MSAALDAAEAGITLNQHNISRSLMTPYEVHALPSPAELLFVAGQWPMIARKIYYYQETEFQGMFDPA